MTDDHLHKTNYTLFDRDFVLKTSLALLGQGSRYEVSKFRKPTVRDEVENKWHAMAQAIQDVLDFVRGKTFIQCDKALPSYLVLIPLVYVRYHFPESWKQATEIDTYLFRSLLAGAFSGNVDNLLDGVIRRLSELKRFELEEVFGVMRTQGRSLELTEDRLWQMGYGSDTVHLLFNLWYKGFNYIPAYDNNLPQVDHIFPQKQLRRMKKENPATGRRDIMRYRDADRNQLANSMLLSREENGPGGKWDKLPEEWLADKSEEYLERHLIPPDPQLWRLDRFEDFVESRKALIRKKFKFLLVVSRDTEPLPAVPT